jgi:GTP pyrophosphokinase
MRLKWLVITPETRLENALSFAAHLHRDQRRKGTEVLYISHLLAVASLVMEAGGSEDETIAALLHDAIEDQGDTYPGGREALRERIRKDFGGIVLEIVNACTDDDGHAKGKAPTEEAEAEEWRRRKEEYITHLKEVQAPAVLLVSCAHKLHNACCLLTDYPSVGDELWKRFRTKSAADQLWYYKELSPVFSERKVGRLAERLASATEQLHALVNATKKDPWRSAAGAAVETE